MTEKELELIITTVKSVSMDDAKTFLIDVFDLIVSIDEKD